MRKLLFTLFLLTLFSAIGMLIIEKVSHNRAVDRCHASGGRWNYMEQQCD